MAKWSEFQFDGLVGPTHNYAGLSFGNTASTRHTGSISNPRGAALEGLEKMKFVSELGVGQALLPPQDRPHLKTLRQLGFCGSDENILTTAATTENGFWLRQVSSASAMWTANAATAVPSCDSADERLHLIPANLQQMFHRSIEVSQTYRVLKKIFHDEKLFEVHQSLPSTHLLADEGAANHTRLQTSRAFVHLFAWGRSNLRTGLRVPQKFPARQTLEASEALARLGNLKPGRSHFPQQDPDGIDAGAFHTDVLAVGNQNLFLLHEKAFDDHKNLIKKLRSELGDELIVIEASEKELPIENAVRSYPFNSQILSLPDGSMGIVAPEDSREDRLAKGFFEKVLETKSSPVKTVHYLNVRQSMQNGGGPACLRLRILLSEGERKSIRPEVFFTAELYSKLKAWISKFYRDRLSASDLSDPKLHRECMQALDELTQILKIGNIYDFQS